MSIEVHDYGTVITGDSINLFRLLTLYRAVKIQAKTGMKMCRVNALATARTMGFKGRTAKSILADMEAKHPELAE